MSFIELPIVHCCRTMGTPTEETWPGVSQLPDYNTTFPNWKENNQLKDSVPRLCDQGLDLLKVCMRKISYHSSLINLESTYPGAVFQLERWCVIIARCR